MSEESLYGNVNVNFSSEKSTKKKPANTKNFNTNKNNNKINVKKTNSPQGAQNSNTKKETPVRIWNLLWLEQVGQCIFIEYNDDIIIVDAGMEFAADEILWADYIIPDISYLKKNKHKIKWVVLTHWHLDHIWALKHILPDLDFPTIYTTPLTLWIIKKTFADPKDVPKIKHQIIDPESDVLKLWCFNIEFVGVNHNIPETLALAIHTPKGLIFNSADFKIDYTPAIDKPADLWKIARIGLEGVRLYIGDSLGSQSKWWAVSEKVIGENLENIIKTAPSRLLIATFASNVWRIIQIVNSAIKYDKVVFLEWRSMINNVEICQQLGYLDVPRGCIRRLTSDVENMPPDRVVILSTWAQWEEFSWLARISRGDHANFNLRKGDTVLMSSSVIPGNEADVARMLNDLVVRDINLITNDDLDIHASGHGYEEDHKLMLNLVKPEYFLPFYTDARMRYAHRQLALDMGMEEDKVLMPIYNGSVIEMYDDEIKVADKWIKLDTVMVDGKWLGHLSGEYVMKARQIMAENGVVNLIFKVDSKTKELVGNIQIESRGFVYSSEVKKIHTNIVEFAKKKYTQLHKENKNVKEILKVIKEELWTHLTKILGRIPMIIPMFVYINRDNAGNQKDDIDQESSLVGMTLEEQWNENSK